MESEERKKLLSLARKSLETAFTGEAYEIPACDIRRGAFVTLRKNSALRGCIGYLEGVWPLYREIWNLARSAAFEDYRFPPVKESELSGIKIEISVLTLPEAVNSPEEYRLGTDGMILSLRGRKAVFLPQVADETGWTLPEMLSALSEKAGLPRDAWHERDARFMAFQAEVFSEE